MAFIAETQSTFPAQLAEKLFRHPDTPWAVPLTAAVSRHLCRLTPDYVRKPFETVNTTLLNQWPGQERHLDDIYWGEAAKCWECLGLIPSNQDELVNVAQQLIKCMYVQLCVLERFELKLEENRVTLPNDMNDVSPKTLKDPLDHYIKTLSPDRASSVTARIISWIETVTGDSPPEWQGGVKQIFSIAGVDHET